MLKPKEEKVFKTLQSNLEKLKNAVVISGWTDEGFHGGEKREFDFLIISETLKTIFHIEVKFSNHKSNIANAAKQLQSGKKLFEETFPLPKQENWNYAKVMLFGKSKEGIEGICSECKPYILGSSSDLAMWWSEMTSIVDLQNKYGYSLTYNNIIKFLLHQMYIQKDCITQSDILQNTEKKIEEICQIENVFLLNNVQFELLKDPQKKRIAFSSPYGTGKTTLLKAKAMELLLILKDLDLSKEKVVVILFEDQTAYQDSLLKASYDIHFKKFKELKLIDIIALKGTGK